MYANSNSIMLSRHYIFLLWSFKMAILNTRFRPTLAHVGVSMGLIFFWISILIDLLRYPVFMLFGTKQTSNFRYFRFLDTKMDSKPKSSFWYFMEIWMLDQKRCQLIVEKFGTELSLDILGTLPAHLGPSWGSMIFSFSSLRSSAVVFTNNSRH